MNNIEKHRKEIKEYLEKNAEAPSINMNLLSWGVVYQAKYPASWIHFNPSNRRPAVSGPKMQSLEKYGQLPCGPVTIMSDCTVLDGQTTMAYFTLQRGTMPYVHVMLDATTPVEMIAVFQAAKKWTIKDYAIRACCDNSDMKMVLTLASTHHIKEGAIRDWLFRGTQAESNAAWQFGTYSINREKYNMFLRACQRAKSVVDANFASTTYSKVTLAAIAATIISLDMRSLKVRLSEEQLNTACKEAIKMHHASKCRMSIPACIRAYIDWNDYKDLINEGSSPKRRGGGIRPIRSAKSQDAIISIPNPLPNSESDTKTMSSNR